MAKQKTARIIFMAAIVLTAWSVASNGTTWSRGAAAGDVSDAGTVFATRPDFYVAVFGQTLTVSDGGVLDNDSGNGLVFEASNCQDKGDFIVFAEDGTFEVLTIKQHPAGTTWQCSYYAKNADGQMLLEAITLFIVNPGYALAADTYDTPQDTQLTVEAPGIQANDPVGPPLTNSVASNPAHGSVEVGASGDFIYTPNPGFSGTDSFEYAGGNSDYRVNMKTTVTIHVLANPVANADAFQTVKNTPLTVAAPGLLANDAAEGVVAVILPERSLSGSITAAGLGGFTYDPDPGYEGTDSFQYTVRDGFGRIASASVTILVTGAITPTATPTKSPTVTPTRTPTATRTPTQIAPTATTQPGVPAVSLSRTRTTVNTPVQFTISGFTPNADVTIKWRRLTGSIFDVLTVRTDGSGGATGSFRVPATPGGPGQEVRFVQGNITKMVPFEIRARIKITPDPAARGQTIDISLRGYSRTETIRIRWLLNGKFEQIATVQTSNTGSANLKIAVPAFIPDGEHSVRGDGSLFRQQTNTVTILGGTPLTPQVAAAEEASPTASPSPIPTATATVTAESTVPADAPAGTPIVTEVAELTPETTPEPNLTVEPSPEATSPPVEATLPATAEPDSTPDGSEEPPAVLTPEATEGVITTPEP